MMFTCDNAEELKIPRSLDGVLAVTGKLVTPLTKESVVDTLRAHFTGSAEDS